MRVEGKNLIKAGQQKAWDYLQDPDVLAKAIPGCHEYNQIGKDEYSSVVTVGVGPVKGTYQVHISVENKKPCESCDLRIEGTGPGGFVRGVAPLQLVPLSESETEIQWVGEGEVGGPVGSVGNRILVGVFRMLLGQFFKGVEAQIAEREAIVAEPPDSEIESPPPITPGESGTWGRVKDSLFGRKG
jgi:carbon monoxide dehydrogenase subunit G